MNKNIPIYICNVSKKLAKKTKMEDQYLNHTFGKLLDRTIIWPDDINSDTINPKNLLLLKEKFNIQKILIIDKTKGSDDRTSIIDSVNRSGQNFLRSKTPEENLPKFPDMSKIYGKIEEYTATVVHTLGKEQFKCPPGVKKIIWSEYVGLIAPVFHYVGVKVSAIGTKEIISIIF